MPNRKASRNAYYFFVQEKIPELRRRGLPVARVADAIPYCSADWAVRLRAVGQRGGHGGDPAYGACGGGAALTLGQTNRQNLPEPGRRTDASPLPSLVSLFSQSS